ncbi:MAG TPA: spore germination protein GerW family protein [Anaerolineae bacterium]|nr:spore germination protein GerW family protein [Anaerolineae bacterium]
MTDKFDIGRFFEALGDTRKQVSVDAVFGKPVESNGKTIIPIASAVYGFGLGGGASEGSEPAESDAGSKGGIGGGGGSGFQVRPLAVAVIDQDGVRIEPIMNLERISLAGMLMGAWTVLWLGRILLRLASRRE